MAKLSTNPSLYGALPAEGFVRQSKLLDVLPFSDATLWRRIGNGTFPKPKKLSEKISAWRVEEVRAWFDSQPDTGNGNSARVPCNRRTKAVREQAG